MVTVCWRNISLYYHHHQPQSILYQCKLSHWQVHWLLFLQDLDLVWQVLPGAKLAPTDILSQWDHVDTSIDNTDVAIMPLPAVINALDPILIHHIWSSSSTNPLVFKALQNLFDNSPLFSHSSLSDWTFDNGHLYFKGHMYVLPVAHSSLLHSIHLFPFSGHLGPFHTKAIVKHDFWWPGLCHIHDFT